MSLSWKLLVNKDRRHSHPLLFQRARLLLRVFQKAWFDRRKQFSPGVRQEQSCHEVIHVGRVFR